MVKVGVEFLGERLLVVTELPVHGSHSLSPHGRLLEYILHCVAELFVAAGVLFIRGKGLQDTLATFVNKGYCILVDVLEDALGDGS